MRLGLSRYLSGRRRSAPPAPRQEAETPSTRPNSVPPVVVPKWVQLVLLPLSLLGLWALARAAGPVVLILIAASTGALILNPMVKVLERSGVRRGLAILLVYLGLVAFLGGLGVLLANPVSTQVNRFAAAVPGFIKRANHDLANFQHFLNRNGIHVQIQRQGQTALQTLEKNVIKGSGNLVSFSQDILSKVVSTGFALILALVLSIYLLVYGRQIGELTKRAMPPGDGSPEDDYSLLVQRAVYGYVRGQLLFSAIMGTSAGLCLWAFGTLGIFPSGARYAVFFGVFYGLMELIPYVGPILGAGPPVLVALFNHPITAVWVVLLFVALQQLEGHFVAPQVFRISLRINPILIILSLLVGYQIYGIAGALLALPVAAVIRETTVYLRRHLVLEPWRTMGPEAALEASASASEPTKARAGPAEGALPPGDDPSEPEPEAEFEPHSRSSVG